MNAMDRTEAVQVEERWTAWFMLFLRTMAGVSLVKGLYHWAMVVGIGQGPFSAFETSSTAWQAATMYFAVIDLVAAVGLWLAAAWGGVVWLTATISMAAIELLFPQVYGGRILVVLVDVAMLAAYFSLAVAAARERPD
ncbi:MAG TPA: DUF6163 family protein [Xanthobacteraceae bacterium]|nr:DUF6163 family protein [Xanthobacteraceae bacterium]